MSNLPSKKRYLHAIVKEFLEKKMVFLGGPRQVGKTTLCLSFLSPPSVSNPSYMNYDDVTQREFIKNAILPPQKIILFDEIHKYPRWRGLIKGIFDIHREDKKILVTGSARMDHYRRGGDSLLGRYHYLRLHPFSLNELGMRTKKDLELLLQFGGFPEPFFSQSERDLRLWQKERMNRLVHDDIRDLENLKNYSLMETLMEVLPDRVGSLLSHLSLARDLDVSSKTIDSWVRILENIYYVFQISPYGSTQIKNIKKMKKLYLWDWSPIEDSGPRFENLVASQLLKYCHLLEDREGYRMALQYVRDQYGKEIDFVVLKNKKPLFAVECKQGEKSLSPSIAYFKNKLKIPLYYQVHMGDRDYSPMANVRVLPFITFCKIQRMP